jgi:hypothetical protein
LVDEKELIRAIVSWSRRGFCSVLEPIGAADLERAWAIGEGYPDQDFSLVDRTSFAVMER